MLCVQVACPGYGCRCQIPSRLVYLRVATAAIVDFVLDELAADLDVVAKAVQEVAYWATGFLSCTSRPKPALSAEDV